MEKPLFRRTALEQLSSPEQLDQRMHVTQPMGWLALLALGLVLLAAIVWGVFGRLPVQVEGQGILLSRGGVHDVVAPAAGQVLVLHGQAGDVIPTGQLVAEIAADGASIVQVTSPYRGRILELKMDQGSQVERGTPLLSVEGLNSAGQVDLVAVVYIAPADGKKIRPGMAVQVSPSTVRREEFGFMLGSVATVGLFPATPQGMQRVLGNEELVKTLSAAGAPIELRIELLRSTTSASGYVWSSPSDPPIHMDSGTLCDAWITLSERRPISLVLPIFR